MWVSHSRRKEYLCYIIKLSCVGCPAVNLSVPEEVDAESTKKVLEKYDLKASGSLVSNLSVSISLQLIKCPGTA